MSDRMPKEVYPWLEVNWRRLVPTILAFHKPSRYRPDYVSPVRRSGRHGATRSPE